MIIRQIPSCGLSIGGAFAALSVLSWRHIRTITTVAPLTAQWWKFLLGGAGVLGAIAVATTISGEVTNGLWWPTMITLALALMTLAAGLVLGLAHLSGNRTHHVAS